MQRHRLRRGTAKTIKGIQYFVDIRVAKAAPRLASVQRRTLELRTELSPEKGTSKALLASMPVVVSTIYSFLRATQHSVDVLKTLVQRVRRVRAARDLNTVSRFAGRWKKCRPSGANSIATRRMLKQRRKQVAGNPFEVAHKWNESQ